MTSKIKIKTGRLEVEYEGSEDFMRDDLPKLLATVGTLLGHSQQIGEESSKDDAADNGTPSARGNGKFTGSTATLASKLQVASGTDLILAAAARLSIVDGNASFSRKQLAVEMKTASGYYKKTYMNNLSTYLQNLVKDQKLVEPATGTYALSTATRTSIEQRLGK